MKNPNYSIEVETVAEQHAVESLASNAFGPGRFARSAFRLREGRASEPHLSFVAVDLNSDARELIGSIKLTRITIGETDALLLGPLVVTPELKNSGIGGALMEHAVAAAQKHGHKIIVLVGDEPYYARFGFVQVPMGQIEFPGPVDPARILALDLETGTLPTVRGKAEKYQSQS